MKRELIELRTAMMLTEQQRSQQERNAETVQFTIKDGKNSRTIQKRVPEYMQNLFNSIAGRLLFEDILEVTEEKKDGKCLITARLVIDTTQETAERLKGR